MPIIFSEKDPKRNFIKENMKQLKLIQGKVNQPRLPLRGTQPTRHSNTAGTGHTLSQVKSSPSNRSGKATFNIGKSGSMNSRTKKLDVQIKKGDMAEFLKRKEMRHSQAPDVSDDNNEDDSVESSGRLRDIGCQTIESNLAQQFAESAKLTMLYSKEEGVENDGKSKASGDMLRQRSQMSPTSHSHRNMNGDAELLSNERNNRSRLNAILDRKDNKDPYLPSGM